MSLFFLGGWQDDAERTLCKATGEICSAPFEVCFDRTAGFRGRPDSRPFVLIGGEGVGRLKSFRSELGVELAREGFRRLANTNFEPHVKLLYDDRNVEEYPLGEPISWTINEIVLIRSNNGHTHLAKWPLRA